MPTDDTNTMTAPTLDDHNAKPPRPTTARRSRAHRGVAYLLTYTGLLLAALLSFLSHEWGATSHSLISVAALGVITWHVASQRRWLKSAVRRRLAHPERLLVGYNAALATVFVLANFSGVVVWIWNLGGAIVQVHKFTGIAFVVMVIGHITLNRPRINAKRRHKSSTPQRPT